MAFITLYNANRILNSCEIKNLDLTGYVYKKQIYFFSKYEETYLLAVQEFFRNPENFIKNIYRQIKVIDTFRLVYEGKSPSYHKIIECSRLISDYENYEIPTSIRNKGKEEVIKFREWFHENKHLLKKPEVFVVRLQMRWGIITNPQAITASNSGPDHIKNYNLDDLELNIDQIINEAGKFYNLNSKHSAILSKFNKFTFLAYKDRPIENNNTGFSDTEVKNLLKEYDIKFKKPLIDSLKVYYKLKLNPKLKLEGCLLEQLGFKPCSHCYEDESSSFNRTFSNKPNNNIDFIY